MVEPLERRVLRWMGGVTAGADPKGGHDAVLGDGLHETGSSRQALQSGAAGGEEGADHDHPRRGPSQGPDHQVPVDALSKPAANGKVCSCYLLGTKDLTNMLGLSL